MGKEDDAIAGAFVATPDNEENDEDDDDGDKEEEEEEDDDDDKWRSVDRLVTIFRALCPKKVVKILYAVSFISGRAS